MAAGIGWAGLGFGWGSDEPPCRPRDPRRRHTKAPVLPFMMEEKRYFAEVSQTSFFAEAVVAKVVAVVVNELRMQIVSMHVSVCVFRKGVAKVPGKLVIILRIYL